VKRKKRRRTPKSLRRHAAAWGIISIAVLAALALGILLGRPIINRWRADSLIRSANDSMEEGDYAQAAQAALSAFQLNPGNPAALRSLARLNAIHGQAQAIDLYDALIATGEATGRDHIEYASFALRIGQITIASEQAEAAKSKAPDDADVYEMIAQIALLNRDPASAEAALRTALDKENKNSTHSLRLGLLFASSADPERTSEGLRILREVSEGADPASLEAIKFLVRQPAIPREERIKDLYSLLGHPNADDDTHLFAVDAQLELFPEDRDRILAEIENVMGKSTPEKLQKLCVWLNQRGDFQRVKRLLPLQDALTRKDLFLVWLDATAGMGDWKQVASALQIPRVPIEQPLATLFSGRASQEEGKFDHGRLQYRRAIIEASQNSELLWYLAGYFQRLGFNDLAEEALRELTKSAATARPAYEALLPIYQGARTTAELLGLLKEMAERWPRDTAVQNDARYLQLLLDPTADADAITAARELFDTDPMSMPFRTTLALAYLRADRPGDAMDLYSTLEAPISAATPSQQAVFALALAAGGLDDQALLIANQIPKDHLMPEERAMIEFIGAGSSQLKP
jgi:hypothetical protein